MKLINKALLGAAAMVLASSAFAISNSDNFVTVNSSSAYSAVRLPNGFCSTALKPDAWTGPGHTKNTTSWGLVNSAVFCGKGFSSCTVKIYLSKSPDQSAKSCQGGYITGTLQANGEISTSGTVTGFKVSQITSPVPNGSNAQINITNG